MGRLPDFLIIGAMKSGTTSLAFYLDQQPQIAVTRPKELNFFPEPGNWGRGLDWYKSQFDSDAELVGEASVRHTMAPAFSQAAERIANVVPDVRLVYLVRDPIDRMRSMFLYRRAKNQEIATKLADAIERDPLYSAVSRYDYQLRPYLERFDISQILVITSDELSAARGPTVERVLHHLGTDLAVRPSARRVNETSNRRPLTRAGIAAAQIMRLPGSQIVPPTFRRRVRTLLSRKSRDIDLLGPKKEAQLRQLIAHDLVITRRLIVAAGGQVPDWMPSGTFANGNQ